MGASVSESFFNEIGLVSISFREHSPEKILNAMSESGLRLIEWGSDVHAPCNDFEKLKSISELQKERNIACSSYGTYFRISENSCDEIFEYIKAAKILGTDILRLWCASKSYALLTDKEKEKILSDCIELSKIAEKEGIILCLEFHPNTYTDDAEATLSLIKQVNSKNFRTYWQPNQFKSFEENTESAALLADYTKIVHIFNWDEKNRYPLAQGSKKLSAYLKHFKNGQVVLLEFMPDNRIESLAREVKALREIIKSN